MFEEIRVGNKSDNKLYKEINLALVNLQLEPQDFVNSMTGQPFSNQKKTDAVTSVLNAIRQYGRRGKTGEKPIDLVILPEVALPQLWVRDLCEWVTRNDIGIVSGLEHHLYQGNALNETIVILPFKDELGRVHCLPKRRLKKHYSPAETQEIEGYYLTVPRNELRSRYQLVHWRGCTFAVYNCYELASIEDRSLFKGKLDLLIATELNRDTNYFSNIIESAARDLHCYLVQVNDSKFGDSRVVRPSKTETMTPLQITGGENTTFLTMSLNLEELRKFQRRTHDIQMKYIQMGKVDFKLTPPEFMYQDVLDRIKNKFPVDA